jgi:hypothetical protein
MDDGQLRTYRLFREMLEFRMSQFTDADIANLTLALDSIPNWTMEYNEIERLIEIDGRRYRICETMHTLEQLQRQGLIPYREIWE